MSYPTGRSAVLFPLLLLFGLGCGSAAHSGSVATGEEQGTKASDEPTPRQWFDHYVSQAGLAIAENRLEDAVEAYVEAASWLEKSGEKSRELADTHLSAADLAYKTRNKDLALIEYQKAVDVYLSLSGEEKTGAGTALANMAVIYKEKLEISKARNHWERALQIFKEASSNPQIQLYIQQIEQNIRDLDAGR